MNHKPLPRRCATVGLLVLVVLAIAPAVAAAHARVSPAVSLSGKLQLFSLAVPVVAWLVTVGLRTAISLTIPTVTHMKSLWLRPLLHTELMALTAHY